MVRRGFRFGHNYRSSRWLSSSPCKQFSFYVSFKFSHFQVHIFRKRSPLVLTLRLPDNVVGRSINITDTIREGLRRVIRKASKRKISKRQVSHADDLIQVEFLK